MKRFYITLLVPLVLVGLGVLAGCTAAPLSVALPVGAPPPAGQPAPTVNPLFAVQTPAPGAAAAPTAGPVVTDTLAAAERSVLLEPTPAAPARPPQKLVDEPVFGDYLDPNWSSANSIGVQAFYTDTEHAHDGAVGIRVTPTQDFGRLFFSVKQNTAKTYSLDRVVGVSVWLYSGDQPLDPADLTITVLGSNDYIYWRADDTSVKTDDTHFFSESRLYYLGVKNIVPPYTWVEAVVRLDKLPYEPDYKYVTGIYIKNDEWFRRTYYVDQVHLLVVE